MTADPCDDMHLLIQAELDGELDAAAAAALSAHLAGCPACTGLRDDLASLSTRLRAELPRHAAPVALRRSIVRRAPRARSRLWSHGAAFAAGLAAAVVLFVAVPRPDDGSHVNEIVSAHIRALQPGHLTDVASTDQHTVKPWFDGRIDYAPPVKDLAAQGFPLIGGRLDYVDGRPVAVMVYRRNRHLIDLFAWPGDGPPEDRTAQGYHVTGWSGAGMRLRAVSDVAPADLAEFARLWRAAD